MIRGVKTWAESAGLPYQLNERFLGHWIGICEHIRKTRNDAGHPKKVETSSHEEAHASLLLFPVNAELTEQLVAFIVERQEHTP